MEKDEYLNERKNLISDFNQAKFQILRLNDRWERCHTFAHSGKLDDWKWELNDAWRELSVDAFYEDEGKKKADTFSYKIGKLNELIAKNQNNRAKLYRILETKEIMLRRLEDRAGKGSKRREADEDDMED